MKKIRKNLKLITLIIVMIISITLIWLKYHISLPKKETITIKEEQPELTKNPNEEINQSTEQLEIINTIHVDIKGAIKKPGVYEIQEDKKVIDVVQLAGGLTDKADTSMINLAKNVKDEMVIIIYTKEEVKKVKEGTSNNINKVVDNKCICPEIKNDACINNEDNNTKNDNKEEIEETNKKININTATLEELLSINGIGESKAKAIINYREEFGLFKNIEDLKNVSGIGDALYEKVKNYITI